MSDQNANSNIQPLLAALLARYRPISAEAKVPNVQVVIQVQSEDEIQPVRLVIEQHGEQVIAIRRNELEVSLPAITIDEIAAMTGVVSIRLARIQSIR